MWCGTFNISMATLSTSTLRRYPQPRRRPQPSYGTEKAGDHFIQYGLMNADEPIQLCFPNWIYDIIKWFKTNVDYANPTDHFWVLYMLSIVLKFGNSQGQITPSLHFVQYMYVTLHLPCTSFNTGTLHKSRYNFSLLQATIKFCNNESKYIKFTLIAFTTKIQSLKIFQKRQN